MIDFATGTGYLWVRGGIQLGGKKFHTPLHKEAQTVHMCRTNLNFVWAEEQDIRYML